MPKRSRSRSAAAVKRRRGFKKYKTRSWSRRRRAARIVRSLTSTGMPKRFFTKLRYCCELAINPGINNSAVYVFRANDLYDPDYQVGGHQPYGFDQLSLFYQRFYVVGSKITVRRCGPLAEASANKEPCYWGIDVSRQPNEMNLLTTPALFEKIKGRGYLQTGTWSNVMINSQVRSARFSTKKHFGVKAIVGDNDYACTSGATTPTVGYFSIWAANMLGNDPSEVYFTATIEYAVVCVVEVDDIAQS